MLAFGIGGIPFQLASTGVKSLAIPVYQMTLQVNPVWLGAALALPRVWDAFTDPLMGHLSDRTRSRFGRRRPYIMLGAPLTAAAFAAIWLVPEGLSEVGKLGWFLATSLLFYTCATVWAVPYQSLGYEISGDYHERTRLMGIQTLMTRVSDFGHQWIFPLSQIALFASVMSGVRVVTVAVGVIVFGVIGLIPGLFVRERFADPTSRPRTVSPGFIQSLRAVVGNRGMLVLAALTLLKLVANMFASSLDYYLLVYSKFGGDIVEGSVWKGLLSSAYALMGVAAIAPMAWLSRRLDKVRTLGVVYALVVIGGMVKWLVFGPGGSPWWIFLDPLFNAPIWIGLYMLVPSMIADLCDEEELRTGERREGLYGAFFNWCTKVGASVATLGSGITIALAGFQAELGADQAPGAMLTMRIVLAVATSATAVLALLTLRFYPLNEQRAQETRRLLELRRAAQAGKRGPSTPAVE